MVDDRQMKLPKHGVADTLRMLIAICGVTFIVASVAIEQPWRHLGPVIDKVWTKVK